MINVHVFQLSFRVGLRQARQPIAVISLEENGDLNRKMWMFTMILPSKVRI
jgi:hypothetical protein